jgi:hypothetical protein
MSTERMYSKEQLQRIAETVDQLMRLDVANRGAMDILYQPVRDLVGEPLCMAAAKALKQRLAYRDFVFLVPGSLIYPYKNLAETDGPMGAAALARALILGIGVRPVMIVDEAQVDIVSATCRGAGLNLTSLEKLSGVERSVAVVPFPIDQATARKRADELFDGYDPKALIAIERRGRNEKGVYHALPKGRDMNDVEAKTAELFELGRERGSLTIGVGDGANEIGWGVIHDIIKARFPYGDRCECGCGAGIGDTTMVDIMVAASVSNWGAYGIEACLAVLLETPELLHDADLETRMLHACIAAGAIDGVSHMPEPGVDGMPEAVHRAFVTLLRETTQIKFVYPSYAEK